MDSFHECLQEYGEGLEVVQICLEPEDASMKDEELSALADISYDDCKKSNTINEDTKVNKDSKKVNGVMEMKSSKSDDSLDDQDDDMTITEDDILHAPRELTMRSKSADRKGTEGERCLSKQQSKDLSTSDEMVFAVTPTGLERISFERYWKEGDANTDKIINDDSWKECPNSPSDETASFYDATTRISVQEQNNSLLYIDHEIDGYETCLDDDSSSVKCSENRGHKINGDSEIKELDKHDKKDVRNKDNDVCAKTNNDQNTANSTEDVSSYDHPYIEEHIIKQMKSLRIEPLSIHINTKKIKKKSPSKSKSERRVIEYYNDQAECLKEIRQKKLDDEKKKSKEELKKSVESSTAMEKKIHYSKHQPSEESTDVEPHYVSGCHKCFLESYAYEITKAYIEEATACKYCEVIRDMLELPKIMSNRRMSAPALVNLESPVSETDDEDLLAVPVVKDRRKSAGPLVFPVPARRSSYVPQTMTVTVSPDRRDGAAQRWGAPRRVTLRRKPGAPLGVSIVGGKVDIISKQNGETGGDEKAIFGIFIKNVVPNSPASLCGELQTGDRILEVDGVCVRTAQHERAVELIKAAREVVILTVQSLMAWNTDSSDVEASPATSPPRPLKKAPAPKPPQHEIKITVTGPEKENDQVKDGDQKEKEKEPEKVNGEAEPKRVYSDSESSDEEDERELQGRTYSDKGVEIDRASAGAIKRSKEEKEADPEEEDDFGYTSNKIKKKYGSLGDSVVVVKLERTQKAGLGLSLAGHRDRSRMAVFICGMHPAGAAAKSSPPIKVGDEILEVNGIVLHGRCHLNASAIIKGLVGPVFKIILLRTVSNPFGVICHELGDRLVARTHAMLGVGTAGRKAALEDVAVKPLTQFPVALDEESDDRFAGYKGVRDITVKKGPSGLGIMIIEGRHTEAGRGIFVSDLQEGSAAEQAGLNIGDMILAVNKDSLISVSYDAAAAKLKQTEGVVVLTVCSPNMKDPSDKTDDASGASGKNDPSRPTTPKPAPSPVKAEPPADPAVAPLRPNTDTVIEVAANNEVLGLALLGGSDTLLNGPAAVVLEVYKDGVIAKDNRIKVGDQIRDCNSIVINKDMTHERICLSIKLKAPKLRMSVYRPEPLQYDDIEVELTKKSGRPLGLNCVQPVEGTGAYIGELLPGSAAEVDGRLQRGDFISSVDGKELFSAEFLAVAAALKLCSNKTTIKVKRFKIVPR